MSVAMEMCNFDALFNDTINPVILNDLSALESSERAKLSQLTQTLVNGDSLSSLSKCDCGDLCGKSNENIVCKKCNTICEIPYSSGTSFDVWAKAPNGVLALINPLLINVIIKYLGKNDSYMLTWLLNTRADTPTTYTLVSGLIEANVPRGLNNFIANFDRILSIMILLKKRKTKKTNTESYEKDELWIFCQLYRNILFPQHVPMVNKSLLIIESSAVGRYIDSAVAKMIDVVKTIYAIDAVENDYSVQKKENIIAKALLELADIYEVGWHDVLGDKPAMYRKFIFGSRSNFTVRTVISSITVPHMYDEIHLPWSSSILMLRLHLNNKLMRRGFNPNKAAELLDGHTNKFHPLINELFIELITESRDGCLYGIYLRNPTLSRESIQLMRVTRIKDDPTDPTISMPIMNVSAYNAKMILNT